MRAAKRPLTPKAMIQAAYRAGIVPTHLFGKTQHKTLQARLSEDILRLKSSSRFFRTDPGLFFLSEFRADPAIPNEFKDPFHARRRKRDLTKPAALAFTKQFLKSVSAEKIGWQELFKLADRAGAIKHTDPRNRDPDLMLVWAFSVVRRGNEILSYKIGQYRDQHGAYTNSKSIGFVEMVGYDDLTFFSDDMGVADCGLNAVLDDLDLSRSIFPEPVVKPSVTFALLTFRPATDPVVLFIMEWGCPQWYEPTARRLSLNDVRWIDATRYPNDIHTFEPWSAIAFEALLDRSAWKPIDAWTDCEPTNCSFSIRVGAR